MNKLNTSGGLNLDESSKRAVAAKALRFVLPSLVFDDYALTPSCAATSLLLARALDIGSRTTYGVFEFYSQVASGVLKGTITWSDIPQAVTDAAEKALSDEHEYKANAVARAYIAYSTSFNERNVRQHLRDPTNFPCPGVTIYRDSVFHRWVYGL